MRRANTAILTLRAEKRNVAKQAETDFAPQAADILNTGKKIVIFAGRLVGASAELEQAARTVDFSSFVATIRSCFPESHR